MRAAAPRARFAVLVALPLLALLAGCSTPPPPADALDGALADVAFDGERAYEHAARQVRRDDGSLRARIPGTVGSEEAAALLGDALSAAGFAARFELFNGTQYRGLRLGPVAAWADACDADARARVDRLTFRNVVGDLAAADPGAPWVLLGAHYDSKRHASSDPDPARRDDPLPGADDGASGVGVLAELARVLGGASLPYHLRLVFFDGEDGFEDCHPLAGSLWHAQRGVDAASVRAFVLLDMVGNASATFPREGNGQEAAPWILDDLWAAAARLGVSAFVDRPGAPITDDHVAFLAEGVPAVDVIHLRDGRSFPGHWHTTADDVAVLDAAMLGNVGRVVEGTLRWWAAEPARLERGAA